MFKAFRDKPVVVFVFLMFLLPQMHHAIHSISHSHDFHCKAITEKHYHQAEADCELCDHVLPNQLATPPDFQQSFARFACFSQFIVTDENFVSLRNGSPSPRGPPFS